MNGYEAIAEAIRRGGLYRRPECSWGSVSALTPNFGYTHAALLEEGWEVRDTPPPEIDWSRVRVGAQGTTRGGATARLICNDRKHATEPHIWLVDGVSCEECISTTTTGVYWSTASGHCKDIVSIEYYGDEGGPK